MAADERNRDSSDLESLSLSAHLESGSGPRSSGDSDISSASRCRASSLPSYVIVQRQMQDVLLAQRAAVEHLVRNNIDVLNESKTSFGKVVSSQEEKLRMLEIDVLNESKTSFGKVVSSQEEKLRMLEKSITNDYVPKVKYESLRMEMQEDFAPKESLIALQKNLEQEYEHRSQTETRFHEVLDKLDVALCQVAALTKQTEGDQLMFQSTCESLREEIHELQARNSDLESRLAEKTWQCEEQKDQIARLSAEMEALQKKQQNQTVKYKQMVLEANVEKQQEVYLSHLFHDQNKNRKKYL